MIVPRAIPALLLAGCVGTCLMVLGMGMGARADVPHQRTTEEDTVLPLPRWSDQEMRAFRENLVGEAGGLLPATDGMNDNIHDLLNSPPPFGPRLDQRGLDANGEISPRLRPEEMRLFLPESLLGASAQNQANTAILPTSLSALKVVTPEFLAVASRALPQEYLIDPDSLMTEVHEQELTRFLEFHAHDAYIKLHVLILPTDRKLPANASLDAVCSGSLARGNACLLVYPLGEPWRARLFLSKTVHEHASAEFMKETARACVEESLHSSDLQDQLRDYAVELSTRLFWLQKALGSTMAQPSAKGQPLAEIAIDTPAEAATAVPAAFPTTLLGCTVGLLMLGMLARPVHGRWREWRRVRLQNRVWMLPEVETVPRLGGAFSGGGGGMLRYAKSAV